MAAIPSVSVAYENLNGNVPAAADFSSYMNLHIGKAWYTPRMTSRIDVLLATDATAFAGSQRRSGVTVTAFNLASWLAARGAEVAYIEVNQNRHLQLLLNIYEAAPDGEHYTIDGIDCYLTNEPDKVYQFIIYDCGVMQTPT